MKPIIIDIAGTIKELVKWALMQALLLIGVVLFGLSAPLLFTVRMEWLVWKNYDLSTWNVVYFFPGPLACAIWMVFICYLADLKYWRAFRRQKSGEILHWQEDYGGTYATVAKSIGFLVGGFLGSVLAEAVLVTKVIRMFPDNVSVRTNTLVFYAIAPFFVFAPVLLVLVSRWIRRRDYSGETPSLTIPEQIARTVGEGNLRQTLEIAKRGPEAARSWDRLWSIIGAKGLQSTGKRLK